MNKKYLGILILILLGSFATALSIEQALSVEVIPGRFNIFSPIEDFTYDHRMVPLNLSMDGRVKKFRYGYIDNGGELVTLCRNCNEYGLFKIKAKPFDDGFHELTLLGIFEQGTLIQTVNFTIDTKNPKIKKTSPKRGKTDGHFGITFQEANPKNLTLIYGNGFTNVEEMIDIESQCFKNRNDYQCNVNVNLSEFYGQEIVSWFELEDILGNRDESKHLSLIVGF